MNALTALHHVTLIDGTGGDPLPDATVALRDGRIAYAGKARKWLPSLQEDIINMDFSGKYVMPGLIDGHVDLARGGEAHGRLQGSDGVIALRMLSNARRSLIAGITTLRDLGGWNGLEYAVRDSIRKGEFGGPRLLLAGSCLTGSEAAASGLAGRYRLVKGPEESRRASREAFRRGADVLSLGISGAMLVPGDTPTADRMGTEDIRAAVSEADDTGRRVAAQAHGIEGIRHAVLAGVHTVEHGTNLHEDPDVLATMKEHGTFLLPALNAARVIAQGGTSRVPDWYVDRMKGIFDGASRSFVHAHEAGVPVAMGSAAGTPLNRHGENALEALSLQQAGMTPMQALVASTLTSARALGRDSDLGSIEEGKLGDLLVLDSDPCEDLSRLADKRQIRAVFLEGKLVARQPTDAYPKTVLARDCLLIGQ